MRIFTNKARVKEFLSGVLKHDFEFFKTQKPETVFLRAWVKVRKINALVYKNYLNFKSISMILLTNSTIL